jgi:hypothetical protein
MHYTGYLLHQYDDYYGDHEFDVPEYSKVQPKDILKKSYELVNADAQNENIVGSTTALIGILRVYSFYAER